MSGMVAASEDEKHASSAFPVTWKVKPPGHGKVFLTDPILV